MNKNNRGSILILVFWAMVVLMVMGLVVARRANAHISAVRYQLGKVRGKYAAYAGLFYVINHLRADLNNSESAGVDTLFACGIPLDRAAEIENIFSRRNVGDAVFDVIAEDDPLRFGLSDETAKINLNGLTETTIEIFRQLLLGLDVDEREADIIAASVMDWTDKNDVVFEENLGAEQEYYQRLSVPYACKNYFFESPEELLMVRGMTEDIFERIRPYITVYPYQGAMMVNFNTAQEPVLQAMAMAVTRSKTGTNEIEARDFVEKLIVYRNGSDGIWGTKDDEGVDLGKMPFSGPETAIAAALTPMQSARALFVRVHIEASDVTSRKTRLDAVIRTDGLEVVSLFVQ